MTFCISYLQYPRKALAETYRVLKSNGCLILGFIDKESRIGKDYEKHKSSSVFYKNAKFYSVPEVKEHLMAAGFKDMTFSQTLFSDLNTTTSIEESIPGYGKGSYVLVKAIK